MDHEFAMRLVVFEYLLPMQRHLRAKAVYSSVRNANLNEALSRQEPEQIHGLFEHLLTLSDRLLGMHGFPTSYFYPVRMMYDDNRYNDRKNVKALIDAPVPFVWNPQCTRPSDPNSGFRTFNSGPFMASGILVAPAPTP